MNKPKTRTFIVELWAAMFDALRWVSTFQLVRTIFKGTRRSYVFVDVWVLGNLLVAFVALVLSPPAVSLVWRVVLIYAGLRVVETVVYQANVLLFDEYRAKKKGQSYAIRGFRRVVVLLLHNYVEIMAWYALFYLSFKTSFENGCVKLHTSRQALGLSFHTMTTFGYATTTSVGPIGDMLVFSQSAIGIFMALVVLARFIALIPPPRTLDEFE